MNATSQTLIPTFTGCLNGEEQTLVNARDLHEFLGIDTPFHKWIVRRISEYEFAQDIDFCGVDKIVRTEAGFFGAREKVIVEYHLSIDMAKELAMIERNERGRQVRRYFIEIEKRAREFALTPTVSSNRLPNARDAWLIDELQDEFYKANPALLKLSIYFNMGLKHAEIGKLLDMSASAVRGRLKKMARLGLVDYQPSERHARAARASNLVRAQKRAFLAAQSDLGLEG